MEQLKQIENPLLASKAMEEASSKRPWRALDGLTPPVQALSLC
jgi:hypothetical protein